MSTVLHSDTEAYRDQLSTINEAGDREWLYPKKPQGKFYNYRMAFSLVLLTFFLSGPFLRIGGQPLLLLNIFDRKFVLLGQVFWPQDFYLFGLAMITMVVFVTLFTVAFGRLFCGWACPQTIFLEMVFRKIEYWIEGDANQQRKLTNQPWNREKVLKRVSKHTLFVLMALVFTHTVMAYMLGIEQVQAIVSSPPSEHLAGFIALVAFTGAFYGVFGFLREQVCTIVCPYGRLQGVLLDKSSIVVAYDWLRGEPRGHMSKKAAAAKNAAVMAEKPKGDCVDCGLCVQVCPTGIDIRNGTQLECTNCTACMDACDAVMVKVGRPQGLVRYASAENIETGQPLRVTPRLAGYSTVLLLLLGVLGYLLTSRTDVEATVLRVPGMTYQVQDDGRISNLYNIQFVNKTLDEVTLDVRILDFPEATLRRVGEQALTIPAGGMTEGVFFIAIPREVLTDRKTPLRLELTQGERVLAQSKTNFMSPGQ